MKLLLDTHVLLWWLQDEDLEAAAGEAIANPDNLLFVSAASIWEISIKSGLGKLQVEGNGVDTILEAIEPDFEQLAISFNHAALAGSLTAHHRDPFDRMLIAQAGAEEMVLVTRDRQLDAYEIPILRA